MYIASASEQDHFINLIFYRTNFKSILIGRCDKICNLKINANIKVTNQLIPILHSLLTQNFIAIC